MRQWIDLFEDSLADAVKKMVPHDTDAAAGHGYDEDGNDFEITDEHVAAMKAMIDTKMQTPIIYRYVLLRPNQLSKYLSGPLGTFWCHDLNINLHALTGWDTAGEDCGLYRLTATIDPHDIDMPRTILQNLAVPWEHEIKVNPGASVMVKRVDLLPDFDVDDTSVAQPFDTTMRRA
jgi:hypothetical protein